MEYIVCVNSVSRYAYACAPFVSWGCNSAYKYSPNYPRLIILVSLASSLKWVSEPWKYLSWRNPIHNYQNIEIGL